MNVICEMLQLILQPILFCLLTIRLSLYSVLVFALNLHYKILWACSSRPLVLYVHRLGCCVRLNVVRIKPINVWFLIFAHQLPCRQCHDSAAGPDVGRWAAGVGFLFYHSNIVVHHLELEARKNCRHHLVRLFQFKPRPHSISTLPRPHIDDFVHLPKTQTGWWWDTHALDIWQFHCQITLKTVCFQPYWEASTWVLLCTLHRIILQ